MNVALTRSDATRRPGGQNWQQWLTVHDAITGEPILLVREILRADGSIGYRHAATGRKLRGSLDSLIRSAIQAR